MPNAVSLSAREKFRMNEHVKLTPKAHEHGLSQRHTTGVVVGFGRDENLVIVRPDGIKSAAAYHMDFWEVTGVRGL